MTLKMKNHCSLIFLVLELWVVWSLYEPGKNIKNCELSMLEVEAVDEKTELKDNVIMSAGYKDKTNYTDNMVCGWNITSTNGTGKMIITLHDFQLEESKQCSKFDYVRVFQRGIGPEWTVVQDYICGTQDEKLTFPIWGISAYIEFVTDESKSGRGFKMTYNMIYNPAFPKIICLSEKNDTTCSRNVTATEGDDLTLHCNATNNPAVTWLNMTNDGKALNIPQSRMKIGTPQEDLTLLSLTLYDTGYYVCKLTHQEIDPGVMLELIYVKVLEKCNCPKEVHVVWYDYPPYTQYVKDFDINEQPVYKGIFYQIVNEMLTEVCGDCKQGHGKSEISWDGAENRKRTLNDIKALISSDDFDVALPILHYKGETKYREHAFLPLLENPGFQFLKKQEMDGGIKVFQALWGVHPILMLTVVFIVLAGIFVWMFDTYWNEEEFPKPVIKGMLNGAWWAYITMTTVGYGDKAPRGIPGRLFSVVWMLGGLVILSILTGAISTALTIANMENVETVYDTELAAMNHSEEYRYGVTKKGRMKAYNTFQDIKNAINNGECKGVIVDIYVAGYHEELDGLAKNNILDMSHMIYGVVFGNRISDPRTYELFEKFLERKDMTIDLAIAENTKPLQDPPQFQLIDATSDMFVAAVLTLFGILLVFSLLGLAFEYGYLKPKQQKILDAKNLEMIESRKIKQYARSEQLMKQALLSEIEDFNEIWNVKIAMLEKKFAQEKEYFEEDQREIEKEQKQDAKMEMKKLQNENKSEIAA